jgi:hypothetical protein
MGCSNRTSTATGRGAAWLQLGARDDALQAPANAVPSVYLRRVCFPTSPRQRPIELFQRSLSYIMASTHAGDDIPPPLQDIPTAKEKKYDRQLRLWGAAGQIALEETHILLINSGSGVTGVETLKNLVLPGIGQFSILDPAVVKEADLGVNFFLEDESLGKFRADETVKHLMELNPGVQGHAISEVCRY